MSPSKDDPFWRVRNVVSVSSSSSPSPPDGFLEQGWSNQFPEKRLPEQEGVSGAVQWPAGDPALLDPGELGCVNPARLLLLPPCMQSWHP